MKFTSPCRDAVQDAFYEIGDLIDGITRIDIKLNCNPSLMVQRVKIDESAFVKKQEKVQLAPVVPMEMGNNVVNYLKEQNYPTQKLEQKQLQKQK